MRGGGTSSSHASRSPDSIFSRGVSPHNWHSPWQPGCFGRQCLKPEARFATKPRFPAEPAQGFPGEISRRCHSPKNFGGVSRGEATNPAQLEGAARGRASRSVEPGGRGEAATDSGSWAGDAGEARDDLSRLCHVPANQSRILASESRTPEAGGDASQ